ncbi:putative serine/threonine kinase [Planktothrix paucivesiculata PCC 9631]|uniref:Serine/threonine kinase n=3 Tax=Planktothrix TaxID=54304 RepID=A0A7Z9C2R1_9CYAN|nr:putative serine/threonine kinase [Planktothrix paucivesiculata PCC 9631]
MTLPKFKPKVPRRSVEEFKRQGMWTITGRLSYLTYGLRYGLYSLIPPSLRWFFPLIQEDVRDLFRPETEEETAAEEIPPSVEIQEEFLSGGLSLYEKYRCPFKNPLNCQEPRAAIADNPEVKSCPKCSFPAPLPSLGEIQGKRGRYRIERFINSQGQKRIYTGIQLLEEQPVMIQEYLLPKRYFNEKEAIQTQIAFENISGLSLADGRVQTGRITEVMEAISDRNDRERCYLITTINDGITARTYLTRKGAMSPRQIRYFTNQALQSLEYLHGQKFRLPNGQIQATFVHGNLSLDSVFISPQEQLYFHDPQFRVYLGDLALWERLFDPPPSVRLIPTVAQDLKALGYVCFYLLAGGERDQNDRFFDPRLSQDWGKTDIALKLFLLRLLELDTPFGSATEARRALLNLPEENLIVETRDGTFLPGLEARKRRKKWWWWLLLFFLVGLLVSGLAWWLWRRPVAMAKNNIPCCISDVAGVPTGKFTYSGEENGIWNYIWRQPNLIQKDQTLEAEFAERRPQLQLKYLPQPTGEKAIKEVQLGNVDFAISSLTTNLSNDLKARTFAYDGLAVYVPFSYEQRDLSLPKYLNGQISIQQLQQLYTGRITNWQQLGGPDLPVRLYIPKSQEAIRLFEDRVLQEAELIAQFRKMVERGDRTSRSGNSEGNLPKIVQMSTISALRTVLQEFENEQIGAIGFGAISQVFGQCSVYPLAIGDRNNKFIQPLIQENHQPIDPTTDLCSQKGSYYPDYQAFQTGDYPLAYPLAVIFRRDNRREAIGDRFAEILNTQESQELLSKTGIIPILNPRNP